MPGSDDDYRLVHDFLKKSEFKGADSPFPKYNDEWSIWSTFNYSNIDALFSGISSIVFLEQNEVLTRDVFNKELLEFFEFLKITNEPFIMSDCVNLYYLSNEGC